MKLKRSDIYSISSYAIECLSCHEQVELDDDREQELICPFCGKKIEIVDDKTI